MSMTKARGKFIVLGTSAFTLSCAQAILDAGYEICLLVSLPSNMLPLNSANILQFAKKHGIEYMECEDINASKNILILKHYMADYIFSSWPNILKTELLKIPKYYCIGSHPTILPHNRGRHPLHWLIILGYTKSAVSFFIIDTGIDTGNVLLQEYFSFSKKHYIADVVELMSQAGYRGMLRLCKDILIDPNFKPREQDVTLANYWRKREFSDCVIDPRMSVCAIINLVRSYSLPYPCAVLILSANEVLRIEQAYPVELNHNELIQNKEPGLIMSVKGKEIIFKSMDGLIRLVATSAFSVKANRQKYIYSPLKYIDTVQSIVKSV